MAVQLERSVDFPMVDLANIAYYPRIFDLAHRFFEDAWLPICNIRYADLLLVRRTGFPVVHVESIFMHHSDMEILSRLQYGLNPLVNHRVHGAMNFENQNGELLWTSTQVTVCVNMESMKRISIPEDVRQGLDNCRRIEANDEQ